MSDEPGNKIGLAVLDPAWRTTTIAPLAGPILRLRHPDHGWLDFWLPAQEAGRLATSLMSIAAGYDTGKTTITSAKTASISLTPTALFSK